MEVKPTFKTTILYKRLFTNDGPNEVNYDKEVEISENINYATLVKQHLNTKLDVKAEASVSFGPVKGSVSSSFSMTHTLDTKNEKSVSTYRSRKEKFQLKIPAHHMLYMEVLSCPGVSLESSAHGVCPLSNPKKDIDGPTYEICLTKSLDFHTFVQWDSNGMYLTVYDKRQDVDTKVFKCKETNHNYCHFYEGKRQTAGGGKSQKHQVICDEIVKFSESWWHDYKRGIQPKTNVHNKNIGPKPW